mgnify:CR=1 FL=1
MSVVTTKWFHSQIINFVLIKCLFSFTFLDQLLILIKWCIIILKNEWAKGVRKTNFRASFIQSIKLRIVSCRTRKNKISQNKHKTKENSFYKIPFSIY